MLVLTRKRGQKIKIDGGIEITIIDCGNGKARVGVQAPRDINVVRSEVPADRNKRQLQESAA